MNLLRGKLQRTGEKRSLDTKLKRAINSSIVMPLTRVKTVSIFVCLLREEFASLKVISQVVQLLREFYGDMEEKLIITTKVVYL